MYSVFRSWFCQRDIWNLASERRNMWSFWRTLYLLPMKETGEFREYGRLLPQVVCGGRCTDGYLRSQRGQTKM